MVEGLPAVESEAASALDHENAELPEETPLNEPETVPARKTEDASKGPE